MCEKFDDPDFWEVLTVTQGSSVRTRVILGLGGAYNGCMSWTVTPDIVRIIKQEYRVIFIDQNGQEYKCYLSQEGFEEFGADVLSVYNKRLESVGGSARVAADY